MTTGTTTLIKPFMGRNRLENHPRYSTRAWNCAKTASGRWKVGKRQTAFRNQSYESNVSPPLVHLLLPISSFSSAAISSHAVCTTRKYQGWVTDFFFSPDNFVAIISFCSFPSWLKKPHREWERSYIRSRISYLYCNRATALDKLHLNLAYCICAIGKSLRYTMIHRSPYSRKILRLCD